MGQLGNIPDHEKCLEQCAHAINISNNTAVSIDKERLVPTPPQFISGVDCRWNTEDKVHSYRCDKSMILVTHGSCKVCTTFGSCNSIVREFCQNM